MKRLFAILFTLVLCATTAGAGSDSLNGRQRKEEAASHRITMIGTDGPNGWCSATAVGDHVLLTAQHCVVDEQTGKVNTVAIEIGIAPYPFVISKIIFDGRDHVLIVLPTAKFKDVDTLRTAEPKIGDYIYLFGHPRAEIPSFYREGNVVAVYPAPNGDMDIDAPLWIIDVRIAPGDSGSAIRNKKGAIVGCLTYGISLPPASFGGFYSLNFTPEQLQEAGLN